MYDTSQIRKGLKVLIDGDPYVVTDFQFVKPGKGTAFTKTRIKNLITGSVLDRTFRSGDRLEPANVEEREMQYLYPEGDNFCFMDNSNYEQVLVSGDLIDEDRLYLTDNLNVSVMFFNERPVGITLPTFIESPVVETEPGVRGDTATGATKPAKLACGATVNVPLFVEEGDVLKVDTRTRSYVERVKK